MSIASKTVLGQQVIKDRSVSLTAQQRSALIMMDGKRGVAEVLKMTMAVGVSQADIDALVDLQLITVTGASTPAAQASGSASASPVSITDATATASEPVNFELALNAAITLCSGLGFKGFGLNMALTGVDSLEKLQKLAPEIRQAAGAAKYAPLHALIFGKPA